jgi:glutamate racemase
LVDPAPAVARQVWRVLDVRQILNPAGGGTSYLTSGDPGRFEEQALALVGYTVNATHLDIEDQGLH